MKKLRNISFLIVTLSLSSYPFSGAFSSTYYHSEVAAPNSLDPIHTSTEYSSRVVTAIYDTLFEYKYLKRPYELKENLAASLPEVSKDRMQYKIKIKQGVKFANDPCFKDGKGRELTSDDVAFSINRHFDDQNISHGKWMFSQIKKIDTPDRYTIILSLHKPDPQLIYSFAHGASAIVPKEAVEKYGKLFSRNPVGSGPWKLSSYTKNKVELIKNAEYRQEKFVLSDHGFDKNIHGKFGIETLANRSIPIVDKIIIGSFEQPFARWLSFTKNDEIHYAVLSPEQTESVIESKDPIKLKFDFEKKYHFLPIPDLSTIYFEFNMANESFGYHKNSIQNERNRALRCAIRKGFNWEKNIEKRYHGIGNPFEGVIPPGVDGFDPNMPNRSTALDIGGAKKLLKDYNWNQTNLPKFEYTSTNSVIHNQMFEQFRAWMSKIGYPKNKIYHKRFTTFSDYWREIKNGKLQFHGIAWALDYPDAENILQVYYGPNAAPGANNSNYNNPEYNKIFEQASSMQPGPERTELYKKLNKILIDDCVVIAGFARTQIHMWHKNVIMYPAPQVIGNIFKWVGIEEQKVAGK